MARWSAGTPKKPGSDSSDSVGVQATHGDLIVVLVVEIPTQLLTPFFCSHSNVKHGLRVLYLPGLKARSPSNWCPVSPFLFWGREGFSTKIDYRKKIGYPYSNLSTGGPKDGDPGVQFSRGLYPFCSAAPCFFCAEEANEHLLLLLFFQCHSMFVQKPSNWLVPKTSDPFGGVLPVFSSGIKIEGSTDRIVLLMSHYSRF